MNKTIKKDYTKKKIPQALRNSVWITYMGEIYMGKCYCCGVENISHANFACGHVISEKNGGKTILDNLRPVCVSCNSSMCITNMNDFKKTFGLNKNVTRTKVKKPKINKHLLSMTIPQLKLLCRFVGIATVKKTKIRLIKALNKKSFSYIKKFIKPRMKYLVMPHKYIQSHFKKHCCEYKIVGTSMTCKLCNTHCYYCNTLLNEIQKRKILHCDCKKCHKKQIRCIPNIFYTHRNL